MPSTSTAPSSVTSTVKGRPLTVIVSPSAMTGYSMLSNVSVNSRFTASLSSRQIEQVDDLLARMSLAEKIGQMTQVEKGSITPDEVTEHYIGSVLSGGGGNPSPNTPSTWVEMVKSYTDAALKTPLAIPLLYGVDGVHGHNNVYGATIFPHNIGLGATGDPELVKRIGQAVALELRATSVNWDLRQRAEY